MKRIKNYVETIIIKTKNNYLLQKANYYYNKNMNRTNKHRKYYYNETTKSMELLV